MGYWYTPFYRYVFRLLNRITSRVVANSESAKRAAVEISVCQLHASTFCITA